MGFLRADAELPIAYNIFTTANATIAISDHHWLFVDGVEMDPAFVNLGQHVTTLWGAQPIVGITKVGVQAGVRGGASWRDRGGA